jgi:hypothetical protein
MKFVLFLLRRVTNIFLAIVSCVTGNPPVSVCRNAFNDLYFGHIQKTNAISSVVLLPQYLIISTALPWKDAQRNSLLHRIL